MICYDFIIIIIITIIYYAEAARHTDDRYYNTTRIKHKSCKHKTQKIVQERLSKYYNFTVSYRSVYKMFP